MDVTSVTTNVANTTCSGTFQVSSDNFGTCVQMSSSPSNSNSGKTFTIIPSSSLSSNTNYKKIQLDTEIKDSKGNILTNLWRSSEGFITKQINQ